MEMVADKDVIEVGYMALRMDGKEFTQPMSLFVPKQYTHNGKTTKKQVVSMKRVVEILLPRMEQYFAKRTNDELC